MKEPVLGDKSTPTNRVADKCPKADPGYEGLAKQLEAEIRGGRC